MSSRALLALLAAALLALAGCGGSDVAYEEVPGPPVQVTVPDDTSALAAQDDAASTTDEDAAADETPTPEATTAPSGGVAAPTATAAPPAATATPQSGGAGAPGENEFDAFCNENPGAC